QNKQRWLVSFNGRTFDLPVLKYRAMLYHIECAGHYKTDYYYRYSWQNHCDLLEHLSDYGSSARMKMQELCVLFKLPGKLGMSGDKVAVEYDKGNIKLIKEYCEIDVINTYLIFLRYIHHRNIINSEYYNYSIENVTKYLKENCSNREHLKTFYDAWTEIDCNIN
ncbi:MAG: 3'-5' exonuclease, partial [Anaplasmataceae bacterium]|nr:3'-5' exonuclease [Anaplasmataceae bacterium]